MIPEIAPQRLCQVIAGFAPASVLCLGTAEAELFDPCRSMLPDCHVETRERPPTLQELETEAAHDLILVSGVLEGLPRAEGEQLIARLRDLGAPRLILALSPDAGWTVPDLLALGLVVLGDLKLNDRGLRLFAFDIAAYKTTPDWLNSRYWAHPELWGKYWW